jgi:beta-glucanase (GH16 family)
VFLIGLGIVGFTPQLSAANVGGNLLQDYIREMQLTYVERSNSAAPLDHFSDQDLVEFEANFAGLKREIAADAKMTRVVEEMKRTSLVDQKLIYTAAAKTFSPTWAQQNGISTCGQTDAGQKAEKILGSFIISHVKGRVSGKLAAPAPLMDAVTWKLVFSDEFNGADGAFLDESKWSYDVGGKGWGNNELQYYTPGGRNASLKQGNLVITAAKETLHGNSYTSARVTTKGKADWSHGKFEVRAKLPRGKGVWPAIWLLPIKDTYGDYRKNGEIDILEMIGSDTHTFYGTNHYFAYGKYHTVSNRVSTPTVDRSKDFHVYGIEWDRDWIRYTLDGRVYASFKSAKVFPDASYRPYDQPFYLLMNVAVGGTWPGSPDNNTVFPQQMLIDYVRVYQPSSGN